MSSQQTKNTRKTTTSSAARPKTTTGTTRTAAATPAPVQDPDAPYMWTHDYDYVKKDLTKLAIVSAALFAVIIVAGFFF